MRTPVRELLLAERDAAAKALLSINARINTAAPVSRLAPEILAQIFSYCAEDEMTWRRKEGAGVGWISVTHVCRRWRQIALDYSRLWRHIILPLNNRLAEEWISRAKAAPITVSWIHASTHKISADRLIPSTLSQVECLDFHEFNGIYAGLLHFVTSPAPLLKEAHIRWLSALPHDLFGGSAPVLRHLSISECTRFPWTSPIISNLVYLKVEYAVRDAHQPIGAELFSAICNAKALKKLALIGCVPRTSPHSTNLTYTPPHLQFLHLSGDAICCIDFVRRIRFPDAGVALRLRCRTFGPATIFLPLLPLLSIAGGASPASFSKFCFEFRSHRTLSLTAERPGGADTPCIDLVCEWDHGGWTFMDLMGAACQALSVEHLVELTVKFLEIDEELTQEIDRARWVSLFGSAKRVSAATICGSAVYSFCEALSLTTHDGRTWQDHDTDGEDAGGDSAWFFLPQLGDLDLFNMKWSHHHTERKLLLSDLLLLSLHARNKGHAPKLQLTVDHCSTRTAEKLRPHLISLQVDEDFFMNVYSKMDWREDEGGEDEDENGESEIDRSMQSN
ncbi:hypothetical protein BV25DRAFT_1826645 [Artomyces pyxidatus]|uniref:Uncharacterized protein n=1 Tax=Artomyces pyxidatus TaxID=48021 RepID=A0ACB8SZ52_9AGAM|nr:hypothetical protein BV25DRAFT_1826645 [Artomyces pyxidatus]